MGLFIKTLLNFRRDLSFKHVFPLLSPVYNAEKGHNYMEHSKSINYLLQIYTETNISNN